MDRRSAASSLTGDVDRGEGATGWAAALALRFQRRGERTVLSHIRHHGPLRVQRPFYPEPDGTCHVYLLHPPGGVVGGDRLSLDVHVEAGAHALLTTPAAGKFYRSRGEPARQAQVLRVAAGSSLEWLPQENIVFDGARVSSHTRVELAQGAGFIGWDIACLGRPAAGETYGHGDCRLRFDLWCDGRPLWIERSRFRGADPVLTAPWGMAGCPVTGTCVCVIDRPGLAASVHAAVQPSGGTGLFSVSQLAGVVVCRYLGHHTWEAREYFQAAWQVLRPAVLARAAVVPRIWYL